MKFLRSLAVLLIVVVSSFGCSSRPNIIDQSTSKIDILEPGSTWLTSSKMQFLKNSVARFEWADSEGKVKWIGTAWAFYHTKQHSVWMTCAHVARGAGVNSRIIYRDGTGRQMAANVLNLRVCEDGENKDMAVFMSDARPAAYMKLASEDLEFKLMRYYQNEDDYKNKPPILMASCGNFAGAFPAVITIGTFLGYNDFGIRTSVGGWYGVSGSAIVDLNSMTVVGMQYRFADKIVSYNVVGVPVGAIKEYLSTLNIED